MLVPFAARAAGPAPSADALFAATLTDLADRPVKLAGYRGRPWWSISGPVVSAVHRRDSRTSSLRERASRRAGLEVVGIAVEDGTSSVRDFAGRHHMDYPVLLAKDQGFALMQALGDARQACRTRW